MGAESVVGIKIEEKYAGIFECIREVPKEGRWEAYQKYIDKDERDRFVCDLMKQYSQGSFNKLMQRFQLDANGDLTGQEKLKANPDFDDLYFVSEKGFDPLAFMEALKKSIENYDPSKNFIACVGQNYKYKADESVNLGKMKGMASDSSRRKTIHLIKLVRKVQEEERWRYNNGRSIEELIEDIAQHLPPSYSITSKDKKNAEILLKSLEFSYLDQEMGNLESDRGVTQEAFLAVEDKGFSDVEQKGLETFADFLAQLAEGIEEKWDMVACITDKINRDILKGFLTKSILIELKLDTIPEDTENGKIVPEPKCRQWCHSAARCQKDKTKGCRVRYDALRTTPPYGDRELYLLLRTKGDQLYSKLLHKDYLDAALPNSCFEDVYKNQLFPNSATVKSLQDDDGQFDFSDGTLARALHKDKAQISRYRKKYENEAVPNMWTVFSEVKAQ